MTPYLYYPWMTIEYTPEEITIEFFETEKEANSYSMRHPNIDAQDVHELIEGEDDVHALLFEVVTIRSKNPRLRTVHYPFCAGVYHSMDEARRGMWNHMGNCIDRQHVADRDKSEDLAYAPWTFHTEGLHATATCDEEEYVWRIINLDNAQIPFIGD